MSSQGAIVLSHRYILHVSFKEKFIRCGLLNISRELQLEGKSSCWIINSLLIDAEKVFMH